MMLAVFLSALSFLLFGAVYLYRQVLQNQMRTAEASLEKLQSDFEPSLLVELQRTSRALIAARALLGGHISVSRIFKFVEDNIFDEVRFSSFNYGNDNYLLTMNGQARSYTSLAEQAAAFEQSRFVESVSLSNLSLQSSGDVGFSITVRFRPSIVQYQ